MLSVEELLYRHRKGNRRVVAKSLRRARKRYGPDAARALWRDFKRHSGSVTASRISMNWREETPECFGDWTSIDPDLITRKLEALDAEQPLLNPDKASRWPRQSS